MKINFLLLGIMFLNSSCSSVYYFYQAGKGQVALFNRARPIEDVIKDPYTDPALANLLKKVPDLKVYGEKYGLKPTPNYKDYVKLDQDSVVYVVTVCQPLKFEPKIFSFPIVGSFNYLGWFSQKDAEKFALGFEKEGMDVDVRGAGAYSTLGWFTDPLLSSMIPSKEGRIHPSALGELTNVVLHESVHATVYIKNQSYFNEALAVFVADVLTRNYFTDLHLLDSPEWKTYLEREEYGRKVQKRMLKAAEDLKKVYDSAVPDSEKLEKKTAYLAELQKELPFYRKITNATLVQYQTYHSSEKDFEKLFKKKNENIKSFLEALGKLTPNDFERPQQESFEKLFEKI